ncbi:MAG: hypothetical protein LC798_03245 [Chloroflexi bacterium]|nr:hypothetical protein [Chloroflexota bacterium]
MTAPVAFLDTETTGLDPERHTIWEVALITPDGRERVWQFPVNEVEADPFALDIGRWWDRRWSTDNEVSRIDAIYEAHNEKSRRKYFPDEGKAILPLDDWCRHFRNLVGTSHLCGAVPSFDEERLRKLLLSQGVRPRWHYHLIDVEPLAAGCLIGTFTAIQEVGKNPEADGPTVEEAKLAVPPWRSEDLSRAVGVEPEDFDRHTALGDARWAKAIYEAVMGPDA